MMGDVGKALEAAEQAGNSYWDCCGCSECASCQGRTKAIILGFLSAMPISRATGSWRKTPWTTMTLLAAIEKETAP